MMLSHSLIAAGSKVFKLIITAASNTDLRTAALAAGWNGSSKVLAELGSGVQRTGITVSGSFPGGVELLIPAGTVIYGLGGDSAGNGGDAGSFGQVGGGGLTALYVTANLTVTNFGTIAGGGGGGGGGGGALSVGGQALPGGRGGNGAQYGGGAGTGSGGQTSSDGTAYSGRGGDGAVAGQSGAAGSPSQSWAGGVQTNRPGGLGGNAGNAVTGNSFIAWLATGTRIGAIT